jgi:hypothetical protein
MIIGGTQCADVTFAQSTGIAEAAPSPGEPLTAKPNDKEVGYQARVTAIAIWKEMYLDEPMVKPQSDLVARIDLLFDPYPRIVQQDAKGGGNFPIVDADVLLGGAEDAGPTPDVAEHLPVKLPYEFFIEQVSSATVCPVFAPEDILPFGDIQFVAKSDMRGKKSLPFFRG